MLFIDDPAKFCVSVGVEFWMNLHILNREFIFQSAPASFNRFTGFQFPVLKLGLLFFYTQFLTLSSPSKFHNLKEKT